MSETDQQPTLREQVEQMIAENPVMLFMKGTPEAPRCGFSMRAVEILESYGVEYGAADVLPVLQPLRQVTAEIADWETFPQLYVKGDLLGGADLMAELHESGELGEALGAEPSKPAETPRDPSESVPAEAPPIQIENAGS